MKNPKKRSNPPALSTAPTGDSGYALPHQTSSLSFDEKKLSPTAKPFSIDPKTLTLLEETSPLHALVAKRCLADGRWKLIDDFPAPVTP